MPRTVVFEGEPVSTQHMYGANGRGGRFLKRTAVELKEQYCWEAKSQWHAPIRTCAFAIRVDFFFKNARRRDLENHLKLVLDALNDIVYADDSQIDDLHVVRHTDPERPRTEVTVVPL